MRNDRMTGPVAATILCLMIALIIGCDTLPQTGRKDRAVNTLPVLPPVVEPGEGVVLRGSDPRMVPFRSFLSRSGLPADFGRDDAGRFVLSVARDRTDRFLVVPYLWEHVDYQGRLIPSPEDKALARSAAGIPAVFEMRIPGWRREKPRIVPSTEPRIIFRRGPLNLPFDEETLVAFFYALRDSTDHPGTLAALYNPRFSGVPLSVRVNLFSTEIVLEEPTALSPEELFLWFYTLRLPAVVDSDELYANLLSLKIAKKLYTGSPSFLGGPAIHVRSAAIPFEALRRQLFSAGAVDFSGIAIPYHYGWEAPSFAEETLPVPPDAATPVKAFFAAREGAVRSVCSVVVRAADAAEKRRQLEKILAERGLTVFGRLYEQVAERDAWAALSFTVPADREKEIVTLFDSELSTIDRTISMGVYRVGTQER